VLLCLLLLVLAGAGIGFREGNSAALWDQLVDRAAIQRGTVATDVLNVRSGPGTDSDILGALPEGSSVEVLGAAQDGFVPVRFGSGTGWMAAAFLEIDGQVPDVALNPVPVNEALAAEPVAPDDITVEPEPVDDQPTVVEEPPADTEPPADAQPDISAPAQPAERWIDIDRSSATVTLFERQIAVASYQGKIGRDPASDGFYSTAIGTYHVYSMNKGLAPTPFADDTYLTDWVGFDPVRKNGIHSPVRDADGTVKAWQNATTLGCVRLEADAAVAVFAFAEIGMRVEVHE
jgi:uncharacterized protein YraI